MTTITSLYEVLLFTTLHLVAPVLFGTFFLFLILRLIPRNHPRRNHRRFRFRH